MAKDFGGYPMEANEGGTSGGLVWGRGGWENPRRLQQLF